MGKSKFELQARHHQILAELDKIDETAQREARALTAEEEKKYDALIREDNRNRLEIEGMLTEAELAKHREQKSKSAMLREFLQNCVHNRSNASTILQNAVTSGDDQNTTGNLEAGGMVPLTINEIIDTKVEGLELPADLRQINGVIGNEVWPYSINDVEFRVKGEVEKISEQGLNFAKLNAAPETVAASVAVSHRAIDNAAFDLFGFITYKLQKGWAIFKAVHVYSHAAFDNYLKSPFALVTPEEITIDENLGKNLAMAAAEMYDDGFEGVPYFTMSKSTEVELAYTKAVPGQCGDRTVVMDGKCVGYPYTVSRYIDTTLDSTGALVKDSDHYIGIGHYGYLAMQQHGEMRFNVDATSAEVFSRSTVVVSISTDFSLSELSGRVNGGDGTPKAFKLIKLVDAVTTTE